MKQSLTVQRMYADEAGETHFDSIELPLTRKDHAPPGGPFLAAAHQPAVSYTFFRLPPKWIGAAHPCPFKCFVVCLSGAFRFITSKGDQLVMKPGDSLLETDTTGKGHVTEVLSTDEVECLIIRLE